jgi:hypothetical protein
MLAGNAPFIPASYESIASTVLGSSAASYTFSSIPQTYYALEVRYTGRVTGAGTTNVSCQVRYNGVTSDYYDQYLGGGNASFVAGGSSSTRTFIQLDNAVVPGGATAGVFAMGIITIPQYSSTSWKKTAQSLTGADFANGTTSNVRVNGMFWNNTSAITSITLTPENNSWDTGCMFALYGIANT